MRIVSRAGLQDWDSRRSPRRSSPGGFASTTPKKISPNAAFVEKARVKLVATHLRTLNPEVFQDRASWTVIGTSGSGKTSLLVKLAIMLKTRNLGPCLVGVDKRKVLARGELSAYGRLIGVPYVAESALERAGSTFNSSIVPR